AGAEAGLEGERAHEGVLAGLDLQLLRGAVGRTATVPGVRLLPEVGRRIAPERLGHGDAGGNGGGGESGTGRRRIRRPVDERGPAAVRQVGEVGEQLRRLLPGVPETE